MTTLLQKIEKINNKSHRMFTIKEWVDGLNKLELEIFLAQSPRIKVSRTSITSHIIIICIALICGLMLATTLLPGNPCSL